MGHIDVMKQLLEHRADIEKEAKDNATPFVNACGLPLNPLAIRPEAARILLEHGANPRSRRLTWDSCFMSSIRWLKIKACCFCCCPRRLAPVNEIMELIRQAEEGVSDTSCVSSSSDEEAWLVS